MEGRGGGAEAVPCYPNSKREGVRTAWLRGGEGKPGG